MLSRRSLLTSATAAAVTTALSRRSSASVFALGAAAQPAPTLLRQLDYSAVTLLPGPLHEQFHYHHQLVLDLDNDKLLKPFRERAGLEAPGDDMGGWYSNSPFFDPHGSFDGFVPGHALGQWISALARSAAITGDPATRRKVEALVGGLAPTLTGRFFDNYTLPAYTVDKLCCGFVDAGSLTSTPSARPALEQLLSAGLPHLPEKALSRPEQRVRPHGNEAQTWDETYTLPENLFLAYTRFGNPAFRDAAARFLEDDLYFNPLAEDINVLPGEHAYSHVNAFSSAMQAYLVLGSQKHLRAATNGFRMLEEQSFATGGWGPGETLLRPHTDELARSLFSQPASFETPCGAYGHFKITRYLLRVTGDPHFGDSMERVLYNTVLGAKPVLPDGSAFYYSDFTLTGRKSYARDKWPCCSGTLPQMVADYGISAYLGGTPPTGPTPASPHGLTVVLFVPSRVTFTHAGQPVTLTQQTGYPALPTTTLSVETAREASFPLAIRIPRLGWPGHPCHCQRQAALRLCVSRSARRFRSLPPTRHLPADQPHLALRRPRRDCLPHAPAHRDPYRRRLAHRHAGPTGLRAAHLRRRRQYRSARQPSATPAHPPCRPPSWPRRLHGHWPLAHRNSRSPSARRRGRHRRRPPLRHPPQPHPHHLPPLHRHRRRNLPHLPAPHRRLMAE